jgi:hypothetical protein
MSRYYEDHSDQLSEKFKDQYDCDKGDFVFFAVIAIIILILFIIG